MPERHRPELISPERAADTGGEAGPYPFDSKDRHCLAQGDSWFSIGALPPTLTSRILDELRFERSTVIVNCADPGAKLSRMIDTCRAPMFRRLLAGRLARKWHVILFSGGGNDLIEAAGSSPNADIAHRLLRTSNERGPDATSTEHVSEPGWQTFVDHIEAVFNSVIDLRDSGINRTTPLVLHNYARVMPRPSPVGMGFGKSWLLPALQQFGVAPEMHLAVSDQLTERLAQLIDHLVAVRRAQDPQCALHVADTWHLADLTLADADAMSESGDWINEIHLTRAGYRKCARVWDGIVDPLLA